MQKPDNLPRPKVLVIGLDGATLDLIRPWAEEGSLPTFARILAQGTSGPLESVVPPLTGPAWTSFMTGKNPGKHGIFDFIRRSNKDYYGIPINASFRYGDTLWHLLSQAGKVVGVNSVPATYPPEPVKGFMVTGMLTPPDAQDFSFPLSLAQELLQAVPAFTLTPEGTAHAKGREAALIDALNFMTEMSMQTARYLLNRFRQWDFFMTVFKETDVAMHWLWRFMDKSHLDYVHKAPEILRTALKNVYVKMDQCLDELWKAVGDETILLLMSDHGAGALEYYIHVNSWLLNQGMLQLHRGLPVFVKRMAYQLGLTPASMYRLTMSLRQGKQVVNTLKRDKQGSLARMRQVFLSFADVDWSKTTVYGLGNYGQLYVNLRGREPQGIVSQGVEYQKVVDDLVDRLSRLQNPRTGEPITLKIYRRADIYQGNHLDEGPDVVFLPEDMRYNGYGLFQFSSKSWLEPCFDRSGGHRMDGLFMMAGPGVQKGNRISSARLIDLCPTILAIMDVPVPDDMDGRVLSEVFEEDFIQAHPIRSTQGREEKGNQEELELTPEQEELIRQRLRGLGYIA